MTEHVFSVYVEINVPVRVAASDDELAAVLAGRVGKRLSARLIAALKAEAIGAGCPTGVQTLHPAIWRNYGGLGCNRSILAL